VVNFSDSSSSQNRFPGVAYLGPLGYRSLNTMYEDNYDDYTYICQLWSNEMVDSFLDSTWRAARAMAIVSNATSSIVVLVSILLSCMSVSQTVIRWLIFLSIVTGVAEAFTFLIFASEICRNNPCRMSIAAEMAISASVFAFVTAVAFIKVHANSSHANSYGTVIVGEAPGTVTIEETVHPDGSKTTTKTTVNADGSKTVEETVERPVPPSTYPVTAELVDTKQNPMQDRPSVVTY
jgi:hypothetical protein